MKTSNIDLKSSVREQGKYVTQIFHFKYGWTYSSYGKFHFIGGVKRTYDGIIVDSIRQGQFTKFKCKNGAMVIINDSNVLMIEVFPE